MNNFNNLANQSRSQHGASNHNDLEAMLNGYKARELITQVIKNYRNGNPYMQNQGQFYAPFIIQFHDRTRWAIFTTTSCRSDRVKGQQWDAYNLKANDPMITSALLVYSDTLECKEIQGFRELEQRYTGRADATAIDHAYSFSELEQAIIRYVTVEEEDSPLSLSLDNTNPNLTQGQLWDRDGRQFETRIASILSRPKYLSYWKNGEMDLDNPFEFNIFVQLMTYFNIDKNTVLNINATSDKDIIGLLVTGGSPKTDVLAYVNFSNYSQRIITASCKRSTKPTVSVHQYSANSFADVLAPQDDNLRQLLNEFQYYGNQRDFQHGADLTQALAPYVDALAYWVLGGYAPHCINPAIQMAQYMITFKPYEGLVSVHTIEEYYRTIALSVGAFGTPFGWTFASGQRGRSIQLKCPVL